MAPLVSATTAPVQIVAPGEMSGPPRRSVTHSPKINSGVRRLAMTPGAAPRWPRPHVAGGAGARLERKPGATMSRSRPSAEHGDSITTASDPNVASLGDAFEWLFWRGYSGDAPYCLPDGTYNTTAIATGLICPIRLLNVARAMGRGGIEASVTDRNHGLGIANTPRSRRIRVRPSGTPPERYQGLWGVLRPDNLPATTSAATTYTLRFPCV